MLCKALTVYPFDHICPILLLSHHLPDIWNRFQAGETAALLLAADQQRNLGEMIDATETAERALALARKTGNAQHEEEACGAECRQWTGGQKWKDNILFLSWEKLGRMVHWSFFFWGTCLDELAQGHLLSQQCRICIICSWLNQPCMMGISSFQSYFFRSFLLFACRSQATGGQSA